MIQAPDMPCILLIPLAYQQCIRTPLSQNSKDPRSSTIHLEARFQQLPSHLLHSLHNAIVLVIEEQA